MQQRREAEKLKEKSSMAPMASPICQEGKIDVADQGKLSKTHIEWKNQEKAESEVKRVSKPESTRKMEISETKGQTKGRKEKERKERPNKNFYLSFGDINKVIECKKPLLVMIYKENYFNDQANFDELELPSSMISLLKEFGDVFPNEIPSGLSPIRGIEHQIDFVPGAAIPNRPAYRSNPEETKELQK